MVNFINTFNATNQTIYRYARHDNFVTDIRLPTCEMVQLQPYSQRCKYVMDSDECHEDVFIVDYTTLYYCTFAPEKTVAVVFCILFLIMLCIMLFVILGTTADGFFCPSLKVLSKIMGLSENLAGVTLLAFGNAAPDLFTTVAGIQAEAREAFNDVTGAVCFVNMLVPAAIILAKPFTVPASSFLRDILFLILDLVYLDFIIKSGNVVTLAEAIMVVVIYLIYIIVICLDQFLLLRATKSLRMKSVSYGALLEPESQRLRSLQSEAQIDILSRSSHRPTVVYDYGQHAAYARRSTSNSGIFKQFIDSINVFDTEEWEEGNFISRAAQIYRLPMLFLLTCILPIVDYEMDLNGWTKLLNCIQIVCLPPFVVFGFVRDQFEPFGVNLALWIFIGTIPLGILIFFTSRTDEAPGYHKYFSIMGVMGSTFIVYGCASELIEILKMLGIITHRSNSFLGCTLLAWGNSVGDLIANTAMAKHGYQRMGFAACFGGPLFNTLLTIGAVFIYRSATSPDLTFRTGEGTLGENNTIFLIINLLIFLLAVVTTNFELRRTIGALPLCMYFFYLAYCVMGEFEFIHPYGSDHRLDLKAEPADF